MLFGGADTVAPPSLCRDIVNGSAAAPYVTEKEYPGAYHGFDVDELPEKMEYRFGRIGFQPEAAKKSWEAVQGFLVR